ncbi:DUF7311 family protein [Natranaeroarchaeum aerophilus]|uniref:DUF7311 domain-containing protein n=1 Tax=Natranaeroarchaeum aerophilus TaxID=2917711 RepID=A0AAE3FPR7_9EURY|nr:hypothetical protein [Natranaeroarchaeum aerophilus]MCL9812901.1 hypothetical protein [Natranaeroarchaeum aerophilus]
MIRYVLAALLTVAILGMAVIAIDATAVDNTESQLLSTASEIQAAAVDLAETEQTTPETHPNPSRVVEVTIPEASLTTVGVDHFEIEPLPEADASVVRYTLEDGTTGRELLDERIVYHEPTENRTTRVGTSGTQVLTLELRRDGSGDPVVVANPPPREAPGRVAAPVDVPEREATSVARPTVTVGYW